ncbi:ribonuclease Z protein [Salinisphaera shabanensis E1L3A]|uniref:Ribonuclease Z protein n=1 Tax=Salinisphaera shabanensis E1L3A TaxID=1033802 RepID=U2ERS5_9GAMM|nr:MBL fold metallo-hydrolase [Salinisphaera shabanensis]ERJ20435.1 ribonuclease Z protein [Salinisphaera shabanensis E1L3A]
MPYEQPQTQSTNLHHLRVGDFVVTTIQDAYLQGGFGLISNLDEATVQALHTASRRPTPPKITLNCYLVDTGDERILIDTGLGGLVGDEGARLGAGLAEMGLTFADIDRVMLTHAHPDHLGGLIDGDDNPAFPQAEIFVPAGELEFWRGAVPDDASEMLRNQFTNAQRVFDACAANLRAIETDAFMPGITRYPLPGHTPDHSGYRIESDGESLLIAADIVHLPQIQFPRPDAHIMFDTDPEQAVRSRQALFAEVAASGELIAGHHIDFPGIGHVVADGAGYRFLPHVWSPFV